MVSKRKKNRTKTAQYRWTNPYVIGVFFFRIAGAISMFWFPWWGLWLSFAFDYFDCWFLMQKVGYSREMYHRVDKWLDWVCYIVEYCIAVQYGMVFLFTFLLLWRFIGQYLFAKTGKTIYFLLTPNMFEVAYMWLVAAPLEHVTSVLPSSFYREVFICFVVLKIIQEIWLHYFWPWYLKKHGFFPWMKRYGYKNVGY